jgi:hypothetical protein
MRAYTEFRAGDEVRYLPQHVAGNVCHPDCVRGTVTRAAVKYVQVRFGVNAHVKTCLSYQLLLVRRA